MPARLRLPDSFQLKAILAETLQLRLHHRHSLWHKKTWGVSQNRMNLGADLFWDFFSFFFGIFFRFSSGPAKCCILQHFLAKLTHLH